MEKKVLEIIENNKLGDNHELLSGWMIRRLYVKIRKLLQDNERYHTFDIFRVIVTENLLIITDMKFNLVEWTEINKDV
jgi:hypothetical protein